ncbi:hypothetical protein NFI96_012599, partial [Prochilodus magdalenae]
QNGPFSWQRRRSLVVLFQPLAMPSDDSMEHLSAEERECLMFLEETIESLEAEDDSGVSSDEQDRSLAAKVAQLNSASQAKPEEVPVHDPNKGLGNDHKPRSQLVPTPLVLAHGSPKSLKKTAEVNTPEQKAVPLVEEPKGSPPKSRHPPSVPAAAGEPAQSPLNPRTRGPTVDQTNELADLPPSFIPEPPVKANTKPSDSPARTPLHPTPDQKSVKPDVLMDLIPPPSDFMDEPALPPPLKVQTPEQRQAQPQAQPQAKAEPHPHMHAQAQPKSQPQAQAELHPQTQAPAQPKMQPQTQTQTQAQPKAQLQSQAPLQPQMVPKAQTQTQANLQPQTQAQAQHKEQTQPHQPQPPLQLHEHPPPESPTIAPPPGFGGQAEDSKPQTTVTQSSTGSLSPSELDKLRKKASLKKAPGKAPETAVWHPGQKVPDQASLPVSCTDGRLVTAGEHIEPKSPPAVAPKPKKLPSNIVLKSHKDPGPAHSLVSTGDRTVANPQKVHLEALKKLGLLRADEIDSSPSLSSSPPHRIPPPPAFSTGTGAPSNGDAVQSQPMPAEQHAVVEVQGKTPNPERGGKGGLVIQRGGNPKPFEIKSASLDRHSTSSKSVSGYSSLSRGHENANVELSPGQLRKNRPRPASAGSQKDFGIDQLTSVPNREPNTTRSLGSSPVPPPAQPGTDSQKTQRSHGMISVVFTPQSKNGDERKLALRKLGLIRD